MFYVDAFILGFVGPREVAAVSAGAQVTWLYEALIASVAYVGGVLVGRLAGSGHFSEVRSVVRRGLFATATIALVAGTLTFAFADHIASIMIADKETAIMMATYLRWSVVAYTISTFGTVLETALQNLGKQKFVLRVYIIEFLIKAIISIVLVFVFHVAIYGVIAGLVVAKIVRLLMLIAGSRKEIPSSRKADGFRKDRISHTDFGYLAFSRQVIPIALSVLVWNISTLVISSGFGQLPIEQYAAYAVLNNALYLLLIPTEAYTKATAIVLSRFLGARALQGSELLGPRLTSVTLVGFVLAAFSALLAVAYVLGITIIQPSLGAQTAAILGNLLPQFACWVFFKSITDALTEGVLRPGFKNQFLFWIEVATLPITIIVFHFGNIDIAWGLWFLVALELLRLLLILARQTIWVSSDDRMKGKIN